MPLGPLEVCRNNGTSFMRRVTTISELVQEVWFLFLFMGLPVICGLAIPLAVIICFDIHSTLFILGLLVLGVLTGWSIFGVVGTRSGL